MNDEFPPLPDGEIVVYEGTDTGVAINVHLDQESIGSAQRPMRQGFRTSISSTNLYLNHELVS